MNNKLSAQAPPGQPEAEGEDWRNDLALYNLTVTLMNNGRIIDAIRTIRTQYRSVGLWDAREYCEAIKAGRSFPTKNAVIERDNRIQDLEAQLAASLEREAAIKAALFEVHKLLRVLPIRSNYTAEQHEIVGKAYDIALAASDGGEGGGE